MTSRKEDEKNERIIRNLLKLADNKRCINCNSLGPQYVCTNFWTFVCTNCSGIHREFTHRVKSISMAKFSSQEVSALQGGGNASAKEIYFKEWDPQRQSLPDGSNVERLRDFIKHVYVERRYSGERSFEKPPRMKMGETEDSYENRRNDSFQSGSRSPPYEDANDRRLSDRPSPGGRSPAYEQDNRQYDKRSPARTEVVNDWRRDDRFGNGRRLDDNRVSDSRSPDSQRDVDVSSPPVVRPVREILGDNVSPLRVLEPPKSNSLRATIDGSLRTQRTASSSSLASSNGNPTETKVEASLIDFDAVPEPPAPPAVLPQQSATGMPVAPAATPGNDNWANFDSVVGVKVSQPPVNTNPLESMLSQLSVPSSTPGNLFGNPGNGTGLPTTSAGTISASPNTPPVASFGLPFSNVAPPATVVNNLAAFPSGHPVAGPGPLSALPQSGGNSFGHTVTGGQWSQPQARPVLAAMAGQHLSQPFTSPTIGPASNQPWNPLFAPNSQVLPGVMAPQAPQTVARPSLEANPGVASQKFPEVKSSERSELPADLFTMNYSSMPARVPGWNAGPPFAMGYNMHYNMPMPTATFAQVPKSTNPFDVNSDPPAAQAFPSMASLQGALPNMAASTGLLRTSSLGAPSANPAAMLHNAPPPYASMMHSNTMMPQLPGNMPVRAPGQGNFGLDAGAFGHLSSNQHMSGLQSVPAPPNNFSTVGGNPFG